MNRALIDGRLSLHRTQFQSCPYLDDRQERKLVTDLSGDHAVTLYNELSRAGFRRSHKLAYHPLCSACNACVPVRIEVANYRITRSDRRVLKANEELRTRFLPALASVEQYKLFRQYQIARHGDSEMAEMGFGDYRAMVEDSPVDTAIFTARDRWDRLRAVCLIDWLDDGSSAVYSFFDPTIPRQSLGTWIVLKLIEATGERDLPYCYLGYWVKGSDKMQYKTRFRPSQGLRGGLWLPLEEIDAAS